MPTPLLTDPAQTTAFAHSAIPALARFKMTVVDISPGFVRLRMPIDGNTNHMGSMYAGALFAVAELPGGLLPWTVLQAGAVVPIAKQASLEYRRPALTDVTVDAFLDPDKIRELADAATRSGKSEFPLSLSVLDSSGTEVMTASTVTQLRCLAAVTETQTGKE